MAQTLAIKSPIIACDNGDFMFFSNIEDITSFLEPSFIEIDNFIVYDAERNLLNFSIQDGKWFKKVVFSGITKESENQLKIHSLLAKYFAKITGKVEFLDADWNVLVEEVRDRLRKNKK